MSSFADLPPLHRPARVRLRWAAGVGVVCAGPATAQEPARVQVEARAKADVGAAEAHASGGGLAVRAGWRAIGPLWIEGGVDGILLGGGGARIGVAPALRVFVTPDAPMRPALSVMAGAGLDLHTGPADRPTVRPLIHGEVAPVQPAWAVRVSAGYDTNGAPRSAATFGLGVRWRPVLPAASEPAPAPEPERPREIWLPYPYCAWSDEETAARTISDLERQRPDVAQQGSEDAPPSAAAPPRQAALVLIGEPGDRVIVDGLPYTLPADGALQVARQPGEVRVQTWGRLPPPPATPPSLFAPALPDGDDVWPLAEGEVLWVRVPATAPVLVLFDVDSATIPATTQALLRTVATRTGDWSWGVSGSFSPEGGLDHNLELARRRAAAVIAFLVAQGVPASSLIAEDPRPPEPGLTPEQQRSVVLRPIPPGGG